MVKNPPAMQEAWVWSLAWEDCPGGRLGNPFHYSYLENLHGQRSLLGYNPWSHKELDTTEQLSTTRHSPLQKEEFQVQKVKWPSTWGQQSQPQSPALNVTTGTTSNHPPCKAQAPCWGPGVPWPGVGNNSPRVGPSSPDSIPGLHPSKPLRKGCSHCSNRQATLGSWQGCSLELKITEATHPSFCGPQSRGDSTQKGADQLEFWWRNKSHGQAYGSSAHWQLLGWAFSLLCLLLLYQLARRVSWAMGDTEDKPRDPDLSLSGEGAQRFGGRRDCHTASLHAGASSPQSELGEAWGSSGPPPHHILEGKLRARVHTAHGKDFTV